jgi:hypothetical protein
MLDRSLEKLLIDTRSNEIFVRPVRHRLRVSPPFRVHELAQFFWKHLHYRCRPSGRTATVPDLVIFLDIAAM